MKKTSFQIGDMAPDFTLESEQGQSVRLSDFRGQRVILYFYPKDDTPGCTKQACGFRDAYPTIEEKNGVVLGLSPNGMASHQKFKAKYDLPFTLLVDEEHRVAEKYGAWGVRSMFGRKYMGIIRSHFVIDEEGRFADIQAKVSPAKSVKRALKALGGG
jgi:peroxiredoxin Q/BCP